MAYLFTLSILYIILTAKVFISALPHCQLFGFWTPFPSVDTDVCSSEVLNELKTVFSVEEVGKSQEGLAGVLKCGL